MRTGNVFCLLAWVIGLSISTPAFALDESLHGALGLGTLLSVRGSDAQTFTQVAPEIVGHTYTHLQGNFWLRPALRLSFAWNQPTSAQYLKLNEYDARLSAEIGIVWSWVVVPSLSLGTGGVLRTTSLQTQGVVQAPNSQIGGTQVLPFIYGQLGVGIPIEKGKVLIEPYARYTHIFGDARYRWAYGVEASLAFF